MGRRRRRTTSRRAPTVGRGARRAREGGPERAGPAQGGGVRKGGPGRGRARHQLREELGQVGLHEAAARRLHQLDGERRRAGQRLAERALVDGAVRAARDARADAEGLGLEEGLAQQPQQVGVRGAHPARRRVQRAEQLAVGRVVEVRLRAKRKARLGGEATDRGGRGRSGEVACAPAAAAAGRRLAACARAACAARRARPPPPRRRRARPRRARPHRRHRRARRRRRWPWRPRERAGLGSPPGRARAAAPALAAGESQVRADAGEVGRGGARWGLDAGAVRARCGARCGAVAPAAQPCAAAGSRRPAGRRAPGCTRPHSAPHREGSSPSRA